MALSHKALREQAAKNAPRCEVTHNPCNADTNKVDRPCICGPCTSWREAPEQSDCEDTTLFDLMRSI